MPPQEGNPEKGTNTLPIGEKRCNDGGCPIVRIGTIAGLFSLGVALKTEVS